LVYNSMAKTVGELVAAPAAFEMFRPEGWLLGGFQLAPTVRGPRPGLRLKTMARGMTAATRAA
jgi:hypothetical protein